MSFGPRAAIARLFALVLFAALAPPAWAGTVPATALPGAPSGSGSGGLYVTTLPAGADVWVDGSYVGHSPVFIDALGEGRHHLTLTKTGWAVLESDVDLAAAAVLLQSVQLVPAARQKPGLGAASFHGVPAGASLTLDGKRVTLPAHGEDIPLGAGLHQLTLGTPRGPVSRSFTVYPETTTEVLLRPLALGGEISPIISAAADYLPPEAFVVEGRKVVIRYEGHVVVGKLDEPALRFDGSPVSYAGTPTLIGGKLYLPLPLLERLTGGSGESRK